MTTASRPTAAARKADCQSHTCQTHSGISRYLEIPTLSTMCRSILIISTFYTLPSSYIYTIYALVELRDAAGSAPAHSEAVGAHALRGEGDVVGPQRHGAVHCRRVLAQLTLAHLQILIVLILNICNICLLIR